MSYPHSPHHFKAIIFHAPKLPHPSPPNSHHKSPSRPSADYPQRPYTAEHPVSEISILLRQPAPPCSTAGPKTYLTNQTACPHRTRPAHPDARQNRHITPNPTIILNHNIPPQRPPLPLLPLPRIDRIRHTNQLDPRGENHIIPNRHRTRIRDAAIRSNHHIRPNRNIIPIIAVERRFDHNTRPDAADREVGGVEIAALGGGR